LPGSRRSNLKVISEDLFSRNRITKKTWGVWCFSARMRSLKQTFRLGGTCEYMKDHVNSMAMIMVQVVMFIYYFNSGMCSNPSLSRSIVVVDAFFLRVGDAPEIKIFFYLRSAVFGATDGVAEIFR